MVINCILPRVSPLASKVGIATSEGGACHLFMDSVGHSLIVLLDIFASGN